MEDEQGTFQIVKNTKGFFIGDIPIFPDVTYYKEYVTGDLMGEEVEISHDEFNDLKEEAKALWGYLDWLGNFVPGLLRPELEVEPASPEDEML